MHVVGEIQAARNLVAGQSGKFFPDAFPVHQSSSLSADSQSGSAFSGEQGHCLPAGYNRVSLFVFNYDSLDYAVVVPRRENVLGQVSGFHEGSENCALTSVIVFLSDGSRCIR